MWCGFLRIYAPTPYSAVFLLHAHAPVPVPVPIKIGCDAVQFGAVWCDSCGFLGCVGEAYTPTLNSMIWHMPTYNYGIYDGIKLPL